MKGEKMAKLSLKQQAYSSIKSKILSCEYSPNSFLNEDLLCEELQVSRTPIRDALSRLEQENLIKIMPKKGFFVAPLSIGEINMTFEARLLIEPYIVLNYCGHMTSENLEFMYKNIILSRDSITKKDCQKVFDLDDDFHRVILNQCNNKYILQTYDNIHNQNCRLRILSGIHDDNRLTSSIDEHAKILENLAKRNLIDAAKALEEHLLNSKNSSFEAFMEKNSSIYL